MKFMMLFHRIYNTIIQKFLNIKMKLSNYHKFKKIWKNKNKRINVFLIKYIFNKYINSSKINYKILLIKKI